MIPTDLTQTASNVMTSTYQDQANIYELIATVAMLVLFASKRWAILVHTDLLIFLAKWDTSISLNSTATTDKLIMKY